MLYLYFRVSGTLGPGFSGAAHFSLSRIAHVKAKGTLDSVEPKNNAVGEQKDGQPRRPTSCVLSQFLTAIKYFRTKIFLLFLLAIADLTHPL